MEEKIQTTTKNVRKTVYLHIDQRRPGKNERGGSWKMDCTVKTPIGKFSPLPAAGGRAEIAKNHRKTEKQVSITLNCHPR